MERKINYITYQTFPSNKANTIQTMDNIKYFEMNGFKVKLTFPLREKNSSSNKEVLKKFYPVSDDLSIYGASHNLPFGRIFIFEKILFLISHFFWSLKISKEFSDKNEIHFTRSDWVFYFLSKKGLHVIFECHQLSKIRKWVLKNSIKNLNTKIIFLNSRLLSDSGVDLPEYKLKLLVLPNGVDPELFNFESTKKIGQILFLGNLQRFNDDRNLNFIIDCFQVNEIFNNFSLKIIGGDSQATQDLKNYVKNKSLQDKVEISENIARKKAMKYLEESEIGLLINSETNKHSTHYTSPLKYFEYLYAELKILAVDFPSHKELPFSDNIAFFENNNFDSFKKAIFRLEKTKKISRNDLKDITLDSRIKKLIDFIII